LEENGDFFSKRICKNPCDNGYYGDDTTFVCTICHGNCELCTGKLASQCTYCASTFYLLGSTCGADT
jgi:proprotein convertase subtilisin/kexin type 5